VFAVYVMVFIVYFCYGAQAAVNPATIADFWAPGMQARTTVAIYCLGSGGIIGPTIGGVLFDKYKNYEAAFYAASGSGSHRIRLRNRGAATTPPRRGQVAQASACVVLIFCTERKCTQTEVCATKTRSAIETRYDVSN